MSSGPERISRVLPPREFIRFPMQETEQSIADRFEQQVRRVPGRIAVKTRRGELTYAQLDALGNRRAHDIVKAGARPAAPVAIMLDQGAMLVGAILGALKAGRPYVGLDPTHPLEELRRTVAHCGADLLVTNARHRALAEELVGDACSLLDIDRTDADAAAGSAPPAVIRSPDAPAYIYYTSGSTGVPKGVVDAQRNVLHNVMRYTNNLRINETDRLTLLQSVAFSGAVSSLFCALLNGATCYPVDLREEGIEGVAAWLVEQKVTMHHSVPSIFQRLLATGREFPSLRVIRLEGDQMTRQHLELFQARFGPEVTLVNGLGATETGISHQYPIRPYTAVAGSGVPVGYPTADMEGIILDAVGAELPPGHVGEIAIKSRYLATGYWRQPELTAARFLPDPAGGPARLYRTGDLGRMAPDGCLEYLGRSDRALKLHGRWVDVHAIEVALARTSGIREAVVVVRDRKSGGSELVAYVVPAAIPAPTVSALRRALGGQSGVLVLPSRYVWLSELPLDANGKVKRNALPEPGSERPEIATRFVLPATPVEQTLARIWSQVLRLDRIGLHDDFSELGGDSLQAIELAGEVERWSGLKLPASFVTEAPCIAEMARCLGRPDPGHATLVEIANGGSGRPFFCMHDGTGDVIAYRELARLLGPEQQVFGLRARGLDGKDVPLAQVETMAARYIVEMRTVQGSGPFFLGGNCFGGVIAFEVARQLRFSGEEIGLLVLMDTGYPMGRWQSRVERHLHRVSRQPWSGKASHLAALASRILKRLATDLGKSGLWNWRWRGLAAVNPAERVMAANFRAEWRYQPGLCDVPAVLIYAGKPHNQLGWRRVIRNEFRLIALPDDSGDNHLLQPPNVANLAEVMRQILREAGSSAGNPAPRGGAGRGTGDGASG